MRDDLLDSIPDDELIRMYDMNMYRNFVRMKQSPKVRVSDRAKNWIWLFKDWLLNRWKGL